MKHFLTLIALTAPLSLAQAKPAAEPVLPSSAARVFHYENGLTLIVEEDRSSPVASVQAWC